MGEEEEEERRRRRRRGRKTSVQANTNVIIMRGFKTS
jgi:hypothetical protein